MGTLPRASTPGCGRTPGGALIPILLACAAASCNEKSIAPRPDPGPSPISRLSIAGPASVPIDGVGSFKALFESTNHPTRDVTQSVEWISTDPRVLRIDDRGEARGMKPGLAFLHVRLGEVNGSLEVTVGALVNPGAQPASLAIENLSSTFFGPALSTGYVHRFQLVETTGNSGATLLDIAIVSPNGGPNGTEHVGPGCWGPSLRVPPGGTLNTFNSDLGLAGWLGYCAEWAGSPQFRLVVSYIGDGGQPGKVEAVVNAPR